MLVPGAIVLVCIGYVSPDGYTAVATPETLCCRGDGVGQWRTA